jgi:hypothetical protein
MQEHGQQPHGGPRRQNPRKGSRAKGSEAPLTVKIGSSGPSRGPSVDGAAQITLRLPLGTSTARHGMRLLADILRVFIAASWPQFVFALPLHIFSHHISQVAPPPAPGRLRLSLWRPAPPVFSPPFVLAARFRFGAYANGPP